MKPIVFLDLETTGKDIHNDRIVEISLRSHDGVSTSAFHSLINPGIPIPPEASSIHNITDEMVKGEPNLEGVLADITTMIEGCDVAGYNSNSYDIPLLYNELLRVGYIWQIQDVRFIDVCNIFKRKEDRTLAAAVKFYLGHDHIGAHGASADVDVTIAVFEEQLRKYPEIAEMDRDRLALFCNYDTPRADLAGCFTIDKDGDYVINFGKKCKGQKAKDCLGYLDWMVGGNFMPDTKAICVKILTEQNYCQGIYK